MPEVFGINQFLFQGLLRDFQVIAPPRSPVWYLSDTVIPVALVNSQITLDANISETAMQFATNGVQIAPTAADLLADTGQLPAGRYLFRTFTNWADTTTENQVLIQHRDAANAADNWAFEQVVGVTGTNRFEQEWVELLAENERLRLLVRVTASAGTRFAGIIWRRFLGPT